MTGRELKKHLPRGARARTTRDGVEAVLAGGDGQPVRFTLDDTWEDPKDAAAFIKSRMPGGMRIMPGS